MKFPRATRQQQALGGKARGDALAVGQAGLSVTGLSVIGEIAVERALPDARVGRMIVAVDGQRQNALKLSQAIDLYTFSREGSARMRPGEQALRARCTRPVPPTGQPGLVGGANPCRYGAIRRRLQARHTAALSHVASQAEEAWPVRLGVVLRDCMADNGFDLDAQAFVTRPVACRQECLDPTAGLHLPQEREHATRCSSTTTRTAPCRCWRAWPRSGGPATARSAASSRNRARSQVAPARQPTRPVRLCTVQRPRRNLPHCAVGTANSECTRQRSIR